MGVFARRDSPFWWLYLESPDGRGTYESTKIPRVGTSAEHTRDLRRLAEAAYHARMADRARQRYGLPTTTVRAPRRFDVHAEWYRTVVSPQKRNQAREASMLRQLVAHFGPRPLHDLTREALLEWQTARAQAVAPATVNRELHLLKDLLAKAVPTYLEASPARGLRELREPDVEMRLLEPDEERRLLAACEAEDRAVIICALDTLLRLSDVVGLRRQDDRGAYLTAFNGKTGTYKLPVSTRLRAALKALPRDPRWLFPRYNPPGMSVNARRNLVIRRFAEACARAGVPYGRPDGVTFHSLRHTGASRMLARGVDVRTVQQLGGWTNLAILSRYTHPTDAQRKAAVELIAFTNGSRAGRRGRKGVGTV